MQSERAAKALFFVWSDLFIPKIPKIRFCDESHWRFCRSDWDIEHGRDARVQRAEALGSKFILPRFWRHSFHFDISRSRFCTPLRPFCKLRRISDGSDTFLLSAISCVPPPVALSRGFSARFSSVRRPICVHCRPVLYPEIRYLLRARFGPVAVPVKGWETGRALRREIG